MKRKMELVKIHNELFCSYGFIFWACPLSDVADWTEKHLKHFRKGAIEYMRDPDSQDGEGMTFTEVGDSPNFIIWLKYPPNSKDGAGNLAHEASHAAFRIMQHWNIPITPDTNEVLAMLTGYIVEKVVQASK